MTVQIKSKPGLLNYYSDRQDNIKKYYEHIPGLVADYPLEVCLAYAFSRMEMGQNSAIYCGVVKLHRVDTEVAKQVVRKEQMNRKTFVERYEIVFGFSLPKDAKSDLKTAETTRDKVIHGSSEIDDNKRNAIARVLEYSSLINKQLRDKCDFEPYGDLRGFKGRSAALDKSTSRWVLKGMGFTCG